MFVQSVKQFHQPILQFQQQRQIVGFIRSVLCLDPPQSADVPTVENRFHPWDSSPYPDLRTRAATIRAKAKCPVTNLDINYTCPISGIPTHHSREAWEQDTEYHQTKKYEILKKVNIYEHDLRSGRPFPEFEFPTNQRRDNLVNFANWDTFFYTRGFVSMDTEFQLAVVTKMLSFPLSIASIVHQYSPYFLKPKGPVSVEGLKSLAALRYSLYPQLRLSTYRDRPMRIFLLNARSESLLPAHVWKELTYLFPGVTFELHFVGPQSYFDREKQQYLVSDRPIIKRLDDTLCFVYHTHDFNVLHEAGDLFPYDPYLDMFIAYHPQMTEKNSVEMWSKSIKGLLESKCPVVVTGYHEENLNKNFDYIMENFKDDLDLIFDKTQNIYGSTKWELNDLNPQEVFQYNQRIFAIRGKRYHAVNT
ncbi:unnamed protein product [Pichia kudriavzevii]